MAEETIWQELKGLLIQYITKSGAMIKIIVQLIFGCLKLNAELLF